MPITETDVTSGLTLAESRRPAVVCYTYADRAYAMFAVPYAYFALLNCPDAAVEIILEDLAAFEASQAKAIAGLRARFGQRFLFRQSRAVIDDPSLSPNVVRFVEQPHTVADNVYIGDIDLLVTQDVVAVHRSLMKEYGLPFSNAIRPASIKAGERRLTGLHYCPYDLMYPLPSFADWDLTINDEHILYLIMQGKGVMVPETFQHRPGCGVHLSLNRDPLGRYTGAGIFSKQMVVEPTAGWTGGPATFADFVQTLESDDFRQLYFDLHPDFRLLLTVIEAMERGGSRTLHRQASSLLVDRRFAVTATRTRKHDVALALHDALSRGDNAEAERWCSMLNLLWPNDAVAYLTRAKFALEDERFGFAVDCLMHFLETGGNAGMPRFLTVVAQLRERSVDVSGVEERAHLLPKAA